MGNLTTDNLSLPKPVSTNQLSVDVERLRTALDGIDTAVAAKAAASAVSAHTGNTSNPHATTAAQVGAIPATNGSVTDALIGSRTADQASTPGGSVGTLTQLVSWLTNRIKAITGATNWYDAPATTLSATKAHIDTVGNPHGTTAANVGAIANSAGSVNDTHIGNRTVDQALATPGNTGTVTSIVSWLAGRIKAITGAANWYDAPATTLSNAASHIANTANPHATTAAQVGSPTTTGAGASGTWPINITGNSATTSQTNFSGLTIDGYLVAPNFVGYGAGVALANFSIYYVTSSGQTVTLPASPAPGWAITVLVGNFVNTTINRNGKLIMGLAENFTIDVPNVAVSFIYFDDSIGWRII